MYKNGKFFSKNPKSGQWDIPAPNRINEQLNKKEIDNAIQKGEKILGSK